MPGSVVDIGCGEGWLARRLRKEPGLRVVGIDASKALIDKARSADPEGCYLQLAYEQLAQLPSLAGDPFDEAVPTSRCSTKPSRPP